MSVTTRSITGSTDTPTTTDDGKLLRVNYSGVCTITLNNAAWVEGEWFSVVVENVNGSVSFATSGTSIGNADSVTTMSRRYGSATCMYAGSNLWWIWPGLGDTHTYRSVDRKITNYTLVLDDLGKLIETNHATNNINITVPPNSSEAFPIGAKVDLARYGAGTATVVQGAGVTVRGTLTIGSQYHVTSLIKMATDEWYHAGGS